MSEKVNPKLHLEKILSSIQELIFQLGTGWDREIGLCQQLKGHLGESKLNLAVLGQFKRGKST
ncbi:MAG: hypothetical protein N3E40_05315, partial [Dehalococcoidia bacterium]|nr:hypothetical protein [Dehalococcoidia bacterium]